MASPPFDIAQTVPADDDIVSQYPAAERTFRDVVESWLLIEHNVQGRHDKVSLDDQNADLAGIADVIRVWNKDGVLRVRVGTAAVTSIPLDASLLATLADPIFTGNPRAPTPSEDDDDTSIATTEFVQDTLDIRNGPGYRGLIITNNSGTPNSQVDVDADYVNVRTVTGRSFFLQNVNLTINAATTGVNGMDTGGLTADGWFAVLVIYNPTTNTTAGLMVAAANFPGSITLPAGYTAYERYGWMRTNGSSNLHRTIQRGAQAQYIVSASVTTALPTMASGTQGNVSTPTFQTVSVSNYVPPTATTLRGILAVVFGSTGNAIVAPNGEYGGITSTTKPQPVWENNTTANSEVTSFEFLLESTNIFYASDGAGGRVFALGWGDNI